MNISITINPGRAWRPERANRAMLRALQTATTRYFHRVRTSTPVITGFLLRSEGIQHTGYTSSVFATAYYAPIVEARRGMFARHIPALEAELERGVAAAIGQL